MNLSQADAAIATYLAANWTDTPISWPNVEPRNFSLPGYPLLPSGSDTHLAIRTRGLGGRQLAVACDADRYSGQLFLAICVKEGTATRPALLLLDRALFLFRGQRTTLRADTGVIRFTGVSGPVEYPTSNGWYVVEAGLIYQFEHTY